MVGAMILSGSNSILEGAAPRCVGGFDSVRALSDRGEPPCIEESGPVEDSREQLWMSAGPIRPLNFLSLLFLP